MALSKNLTRIVKEAAESGAKKSLKEEVGEKLVKRRKAFENARKSIVNETKGTKEFIEDQLVGNPSSKGANRRLSSEKDFNKVFKSKESIAQQNRIAKEYEEKIANEVTNKRVAQQRLENKDYKVPYASDAKPSQVDEMIRQAREEAAAREPKPRDNRNFIQKKLDDVKQKKAEKIQGIEDARKNAYEQYKDGTSPVFNTNRNEVFDELNATHNNLTNGPKEPNFNKGPERPESVFNPKKESGSTIKDKVNETKNNPTGKAAKSANGDAESSPLKKTLHKAMPIAVGGGIVFGLWNNRGQQSNAQLYGQQPMQGGY